MAVTWLSTTDSVTKRYMPTWIKSWLKNAKISSEGTLSDIWATPDYPRDTHLHYEVRKNDKPIDPINFYFNDLTPDEFELLVETANNTGQSMDCIQFKF